MSLDPEPRGIPGDLLHFIDVTDLDSRAAVKGSRDPLGIQAIWTRLGRHVVGNLTTVSNSVRDRRSLPRRS